jgi:hypothetical protein
MSDDPNVPIREQLDQMEEIARQAHTARQQADDDAGYASKAKLAAEEHSKSIATLKGQAEADASWFTATKQGVDQAQATIALIRAEAESARQTITDALSELEKGRAVVSAAAEQAEISKVQAVNAGAEATVHSKTAQTRATNADGFSEQAKAAAEKAEKSLEELTSHTEKASEVAIKVEETVAAINKVHESAQALVLSMAASDKKAAGVLAIIETHEKDLARLKEECDTLRARIESLLPNATSAGLATAFREQQGRFVWPQRGWLTTFIVAIAALLSCSLLGLPSADGTWDQMAKHFLNRLPLIAPLVWLAVYAGRHYGLALRLQEEYAYKEAVSAAFEGYKREMSTVAAVGGSSISPLVTLCESVLRTLGQRPGRIYEGKHEDITAFTPITTTLKEGAQIVTEAVRNKLPAPDA